MNTIDTLQSCRKFEYSKYRNEI